MTRTPTVQLHVTARPHYGWRWRLAWAANLLPLGMRRRAARAIIRHARIDIFAGTSRLTSVRIEPRFEPDGSMTLHPHLGPRCLP